MQRGRESAAKSPKSMEARLLEDGKKLKDFSAVGTAVFSPLIVGIKPK